MYSVVRRTVYGVHISHKHIRTHTRRECHVLFINESIRTHNM